MSNEDAEERLRRSMGRVMRAFKVQGAIERGSPYGTLNMSDLTVLQLIGEAPAPMMRDAARALGSALSTATTVVDRLEKQGLVERLRDEANRRIIRLGLTPEGAKIHAALVAEHRAGCRSMLDALAPADREPFVRMLERIAEVNDPLP